MLPTKPPTRRIPLSRRSHIIGFQSLSSGATYHESALERDFVTLTSFVEPAANILAQPVTIHFEDAGLRRRYTPDFLVRFPGGADLIEVKYQRDLEERWDALAPAFGAATQWALGHAATFRVVTEKDVRGALLENGKRLLPLRSVPVDAKAAMLILTRAYAMKGATFRSLLEAEPNRGIALATVWRLIARGALRADLSVPVTLDSEVRPP